MATFSRRTQTLVQLTEDLVASLDARAARTGENRSALIRRALKLFLDAELERDLDQQLVDGYARIPPDDEFDALAEASLTSLLADDPW